MLKLIRAFDMDFSSVMEYYDSFEDKWRDLNSFVISLVEQGVEKYFDGLHTFDGNMYYLVEDTNPRYIIGYGMFEDSRFLNYHLEYLNTGAIA